LPSGDKQKSDDKTQSGSDSCVKLYNAIYDFNKKYPSSNVSCEDGFFNMDDDVAKDKNGHVYVRTDKEGRWFNMYRKGVEALSSNAQTVSSTLSSENEQQSMRTNQAMNRSSGFLQQLQTMMQSAKDALQAAAKSGTM
jgi:hypothetical protein